MAAINEVEYIKRLKGMDKHLLERVLTVARTLGQQHEVALLDLFELAHSQGRVDKVLEQVNHHVGLRRDRWGTNEAATVSLLGRIRVHTLGEATAA